MNELIALVILIVTGSAIIIYLVKGIMKSDEVATSFAIVILVLMWVAAVMWAFKTMFPITPLQ
jgi:hypothetical protein